MAPPRSAEQEENVTEVKEARMAQLKTAPLPVERLIDVKETELKTIVADGAEIRGTLERLNVLKAVEDLAMNVPVDVREMMDAV